MGYCTQFEGSLRLNKPVDDETAKIIKDIHDGCWPQGDKMPDDDCEWTLTKDKQGIHCCSDTPINFCDYLEWLLYLHEKILKPRGYEFTSEDDICWTGDDGDDFGIIRILKGKLFTKIGRREYSAPEEVTWPE